MKVTVPALEGLDSESGLARVGGNQALYLSLLRRFLDFQSAPAEITEHLAQNDRLTAERLAHNVKGTAAGLGATGLAVAAASLERALREGLPEQAALEEFGRILRDFLDRLRGALPAESAPPKASFQIEDIPKVVAEMEQRLAEFDVVALDLFESHRELFAGLFSDEDFLLFQKQLGNYALTEARVTLRERGAF